MRRTLRGDTEAFRELLGRYTGAVFALIYSHLGRTEHAEDVAQEVFLHTYRSLGNLKEPAKFGSWLYGLTKRTCLNWLRRQKADSLPLDEVNESSTIAERPSRSSGQSDDETEVLELIQSLPVIYREVIHLRYIEDYSYREIARLLEISESAINIRLIKARRMLREKIERSRSGYEP
ncbi:MAG: RNA polymerase sigma factor [Planctomycetes bacterium]|nr:RNA polymerase sigma factor [Planctomycetota bacterium]